MFAAGMPIPPTLDPTKGDAWLVALIAVVTLIIVGAVYGWIVSRFVTSVKTRPTAVTRAIERARVERKAA